MPSPFPGMNPYLEHANTWHDFHGAMAFALRSMLVEQLRPRYIVKVDEHVYIHELSAAERRIHGRPDVGITLNPLFRQSNNAGAAVIQAPVEVEHPVAIDELRENYLKILDSESREVVTVIELLSPANKQPGSDREQYLAKRKRVLKSNTSLVEIDLLRAGPRMPDFNLPPCDYAITISRWETRPKAGCWPIQLRDPLPTIPIPLKSGEADAHLDLKVALDHVYDAAGYEDAIYLNPITPALSPADAKWANEVLNTAGLTANSTV